MGNTGTMISSSPVMQATTRKTMASDKSLKASHRMSAGKIDEISSKTTSTRMMSGMHDDLHTVQSARSITRTLSARFLEWSTAFFATPPELLGDHEDSDIDSEEDESEGKEVELDPYFYDKSFACVFMTHDPRHISNTIYINIYRSKEGEEDQIVAFKHQRWEQSIFSADHHSTRKVINTVFSVLLNDITYHRIRVDKEEKHKFMASLVHYIDEHYPDVHIDVSAVSLVRLAQGFAGPEDAVFPRKEHLRRPSYVLIH